MGRHWRFVKKLWPVAALLFSLSVLVYHLVLQGHELSTDNYRELQLSPDSVHQLKLKRPLLAANIDATETDQSLAEIVQSIPEISEHSLFQSLQLKNLKIYVYKLPTIFNEDQIRLNAHKPPKIRDPNCTANFYSAEYSLHRFLLSSHYRTLDPWEADFFYVPAYSCCFLINNHPNNLTKTAIFHQKLLRHIRNDYPYFNLSQGRDHIWAFTQGFGAKMFGDWRQINNGIFLVHNGQFTLDEFTPHKDITIPPDLTGYNFPSVYEISPSQRPERKWLGHFGGTVLSINLTDERGSHYSRGVRQYIKKHFSNDPSFRITGTRVTSYIDDMMSSKFCLCPEGWHAWNPRPYQAVLLGCIPVLLSEEIELAFEDMIDYSKFMVRVHPQDVSKLKTVLAAVSDYEVEGMRREMEKVWRLFSYSKQGLALHMIMKALAKRKTPQHIQHSYKT